MKHLMKVIDFLFGCHHTKLSRVFTITGHTYRVCFDCGAKFDYSLKSMSRRPSNRSQVVACHGAQWKRAAARF